MYKSSYVFNHVNAPTSPHPRRQPDELYGQLPSYHSIQQQHTAHSSHHTTAYNNNTPHTAAIITQHTTTTHCIQQPS